MKKISLLSILFFSVAFLYAQADVVVSIDVNNNADVTDVMFKGNASGWANIQGYDDGTNGDATAADGIWSATFVNVACDDAVSEWGAVDQNDGWLMGALSSNLNFTVDAACGVTGDFSYTFPAPQTTTMVTLTVTDLNQNITGISLKGAYGGWSSVDAYDDGTNGDVTAGDGVWTLEVEAEMGATGMTASYEWGADRTDCTTPAWLIQGPNRVFMVDDAGNVTGETNYDIPLADVMYNVTFRVNMANELISNDGIFVSGNFETCAWSKGDLVLMENADNPGVYEITTSVAPGTYEYKYFNGFPGTDDGAESTGAFENVFLDNGCGVDGTQNRALDLSDLDADRVLTAVTFNTCNDYFLLSNENELELSQFDITPNPARSLAVVEFSNDAATAFDLVITNITGQTVHTINNLRTNRVEISVEALAAGMYFATLRNQEGATTTRKLIVR